MNNSLIALAGMAAVIVIAGGDWVSKADVSASQQTSKKHPHSETKSAKRKELIYVSAGAGRLSTKGCRAFPWPCSGATSDKGARDIYQVRAGIRCGHTYAYKRRVAGRLSKALISKDERARSAWARESSSGFRAGTNIGAAATRPKARSFYQEGLGNSTRYPLSRMVGPRARDAVSGQRFRNGFTNLRKRRVVASRSSLLAATSSISCSQRSLSLSARCHSLTSRRHNRRHHRGSLVPVEKRMIAAEVKQIRGCDFDDIEVGRFAAEALVAEPDRGREQVFRHERL